LRAGAGSASKYDEALAWARDAVESGLLSRFYVETDRALVLAALAADPLGIIEPSLEVDAACTRLRDFGRQVRLQAERVNRSAANARSGRDSRNVVKRRAAVEEIKADLKRRGKRVTAQRVANELAKITEAGERLYPYASRRSIADDLKKVGKD
jgi:hypothetical protein